MRSNIGRNIHKTLQEQMLNALQNAVNRERVPIFYSAGGGIHNATIPVIIAIDEARLRHSKRNIET